jgi:hypothetical protein
MYVTAQSAHEMGPVIATSHLGNPRPNGPPKPGGGGRADRGALGYPQRVDNEQPSR